MRSDPRTGPCLNLLSIGFCLLLTVLSLGTSYSIARDEWFRRLDLEPALADASLVLVARVAEVSETKILRGGKAEQSIEEFRFEPIQVLKGVFARNVLSLTSEDLGWYPFGDATTPIEHGQVRLLTLGRSESGYAIQHQAPGLDLAVPRLEDANDRLLDAVKVLLTINQTPDRAKKVTLLLQGLRAQKGPGTIPLLLSLERRALLAAQTAGALGAVAMHLDEASAAVREATANTLRALLEGDYLDQQNLREGALNVLTATLERPDVNIAARAAALEALAWVGPAALHSAAARERLRIAPPSGSFAEQSARLRATGRLKMDEQRDSLLALLGEMPLDAPYDIQFAAEWALAQLDPSAALKQLTLRIHNKLAAGLGLRPEIDVLGELPTSLAAPALVDVARLPLDRAEREGFAAACEKVPEPRLALPLARMLNPHEPEVRWHAIEALRKIDTDDAATALRPHLADESNLLGKLVIAEFLGRHGVRDGYAYAIEHMSEPQLLEQAVDALASIREPRASEELRKILRTSNDLAWIKAAVRTLGRLGEVELAPQFLDVAQDLKNPLAPSAIIALGDLGEAKVLPQIRAGLASRSDAVVAASARAAGKLLARTGMNADDLRDQLASLLGDLNAAPQARAAALNSLVALNDRRLDGALAAAARDAALEGSDVLAQINKFLRRRRVKLTTD